jgi:hypothetical protein
MGADGHSFNYSFLTRYERHRLPFVSDATEHFSVTGNISVDISVVRVNVSVAGT